MVCISNTKNTCEPVSMPEVDADAFWVSGTRRALTSAPRARSGVSRIWLAPKVNVGVEEDRTMLLLLQSVGS